MTRSESGRVRPDAFAPPLVVVVERTDRRGDVRELAIADRCIGRRWGVSIRYFALTGCIRARGDFILLTSFQKTFNATESIMRPKRRFVKAEPTFPNAFPREALFNDSSANLRPNRVITPLQHIDVSFELKTSQLYPSHKQDVGRSDEPFRRRFRSPFRRFVVQISTDSH